MEMFSRMGWDRDVLQAGMELFARLGWSWHNDVHQDGVGVEMSSRLDLGQKCPPGWDGYVRVGSGAGMEIFSRLVLGRRCSPGLG